MMSFSHSQYAVSMKSLLDSSEFIHWSLGLGLKAAVTRGLLSQLSIDVGKSTSVSGRLEKITHHILNAGQLSNEQQEQVVKYFWLVAILEYPHIAHCLNDDLVYENVFAFPNAIWDRLHCVSHDKKENSMGKILSPPSASQFSKFAFRGNFQNIRKYLMKTPVTVDLSRNEAVQKGIQFEKKMVEDCENFLLGERQFHHPYFPLSATVDLHSPTTTIELKNRSSPKPFTAKQIGMMLIQLLCQMVVYPFQRGILIIRFTNVENLQTKCQVFCIDRQAAAPYLYKIEKYWRFITLWWYAIQCYLLDNSGSSKVDLESLSNCIIANEDMILFSCLGMDHKQFPKVIGDLFYHRDLNDPVFSNEKKCLMSFSSFVESTEICDFLEEFATPVYVKPSKNIIEMEVVENDEEMDYDF